MTTTTPKMITRRKKNPHYISKSLYFCEKSVATLLIYPLHRVQYMRGDENHKFSYLYPADGVSHVPRLFPTLFFVITVLCTVYSKMEWFFIFSDFWKWTHWLGIFFRFNSKQKIKFSKITETLKINVFVAKLQITSFISKNNRQKENFDKNFVSSI